MTDEGITLAEISNRLPPQFQTLNYDILLDTDSFYKPKVIGSFDLIINSIIMLLYMKPGQYPSIPELGINIESYLHEYSDDANIPNKIQSLLYDQCNRLDIIGVTIECKFYKTDDGYNALVVDITGSEQLSYGAEGSNHVIVGITYDKLNRLYTRKMYI